MEAKETVRALLERLPDDCTVEDILYHLYVLREVELGRGDVAAGRVVSHEEVADELRRKWLHGAAG
jgi:predicted transcriptional regulator